MKYRIALLLYCILMDAEAQRVLEVGVGKPYADPAAAARDARPGDTIHIIPGSYQGSFFIENLKGTAQAWITIRGADRNTVIFNGGSQSMHLTDPQFVHIRNMTIQGQTGNGMNIDDGGTYNSPAKKLLLENMSFKDMAATGNNDQLKLSGLDSFEIRNCSFVNGAAGGSGIDMVGCHAGLIVENQFTNQGSNSIQAKGATSGIHMNRNRFTNGGQRAVNLGGSTGVDFFRPLGANYEAKDLFVTANIFEGSLAPIAYVGCRNVHVVNNTIIRPDRWIIRILQESRDTSFYQSCAYNHFVNNIVVVNNNLSTDVNIGPNTLPGSFRFSNNLWFHETNAVYQPNLPVAESNGITRRNPGFVTDGGIPYGINGFSSGFMKGIANNLIGRDFLNRPFRAIPSIGAMEFPLPSSIQENTEGEKFFIIPNPFSEGFIFSSELVWKKVLVFSQMGTLIQEIHQPHNGFFMDLSAFPSGIYFLICISEKAEMVRKVIVKN